MLLLRGQEARFVSCTSPAGCMKVVLTRREAEDMCAMIIMGPWLRNARRTPAPGAAIEWIVEPPCCFFWSAPGLFLRLRPRLLSSRLLTPISPSPPLGKRCVVCPRANWCNHTRALAGAREVQGSWCLSFYSSVARLTSKRCRSRLLRPSKKRI
jgi:hypothetical protein